MISSHPIEIFVNGERLEVPEAGSVTDLLARLQISADRVAVELNQELIRKRDWDSAVVGEGARVEVVEFVGGG